MCIFIIGFYEICYNEVNYVKVIVVYFGIDYIELYVMFDEVMVVIFCFLIIYDEFFVDFL